MELETAERWLYERLTGTPSLMALLGNDRGRVVGHVAPETVPEPFVVFQYQSGNDLIVVGGRRLWSELVYVVKVVARGDSCAEAWRIAWEIDRALHGASGITSTGEVLECHRERPIEYVEYDGKEVYRHVGGMYRLITRS